MMATIWSIIASYVNERKTGSVTLNFVEGRFAASEEKIARRH